MADQFDIVDIVYNAVEPASTGFILYKDQSGDWREKKSYHDPLSGLEWERLCQQGIDKYQYLRQETLERRIGSTVDDRDRTRREVRVAGYQAAVGDVLEISDRLV